MPGPGIHAVCAALGVLGGGQLMQDVDAVLGVNLAPLQNVHLRRHDSRLPSVKCLTRDQHLTRP